MPLERDFLEQWAAQPLEVWEVAAEKMAERTGLEVKGVLLGEISKKRHEDFIRISQERPIGAVELYRPIFKLTTVEL